MWALLFLGFLPLIFDALKAENPKTNTPKIEISQTNHEMTDTTYVFDAKTAEEKKECQDNIIVEVIDNVCVKR